MKTTALALILAMALAAPLHAQPAPKSPLPDRSGAVIEYASVAEALQSLRAKPGVKFRDEKGWTVVDDRTPGFADVWSFTPAGHPAHPSVVKRTVIQKNGAIQIAMSVMCESQKPACDQLVADFNALNQQAAGAATNPPLAAANPRDAEAEALAVKWLDLVVKGDGKASFDLLAPSFQATQTRKGWQKALDETRAALGLLHSRKLRRVVWYQDPPGAPLPGIYAGVEFDSVFDKTKSHFQTVMLHSQHGEPFRVISAEADIVMKIKP
jgi:hypothetical protein